jgi:hypothetical protein
MTPFIQADSVSLVAFLLIVAFVIMAFLNAVDRAEGPTLKIGVGLLAWLTLISLLVGSGFLRDHPMPGLLLFFGLSNGAAVVVALSPLGRRMATTQSLACLIGFQAFRLPLEIVLHQWAAQGTIPETMTWSGSNLDVITGVVAVIAMGLVHKYRGEFQWVVAWCFNMTGILLLGNVARVAILSSPLPFSWQVDPPLQLAYYLPYAWIVPVCVAGALGGHILLTRALIRR